MGEVRVSSRVNKGKRRRVQIFTIIADEPTTVVPTHVFCHSSPGPSLVSKQRGKGCRKSRVSRNLVISLHVVPLVVNPVVETMAESITPIVAESNIEPTVAGAGTVLPDMPIASHIERVLGFDTPIESI
ncbi:hypothetical protein KC19_VG072700 [Ceratodon purpureus]|uniref:Uncharacterized protein n=1 Tax=Ceratodon purpureus TaxID=3225 RepID=A0A8T0HMU3_CERPU|nr:hypothetical protein KC19_VG072700 [Ceratodon purpureus]